jgi:hypothetical protein
LKVERCVFVVLQHRPALCFIGTGEHPPEASSESSNERVEMKVIVTDNNPPEDEDGLEPIEEEESGWLHHDWPEYTAQLKVSEKVFAFLTSVRNDVRVAKFEGSVVETNKVGSMWTADIDPDTVEFYSTDEEDVFPWGDFQ